jgi:FAD/FMN-containing dehydrogenase
VPLEGGVVLDMTAMAAPIALADGVVEVEAGAKMIDLDLWCRDRGWELKLWPSTKRTATIGGFVAGGGAGVGGIAHGTLRERGNLLGARSRRCRTRRRSSTWKVTRPRRSTAPMARPA